MTHTRTLESTKANEIKQPAPFIQITVAELYTTIPFAYGIRVGMTTRGAQKAFKRMYDNGRKAPASMGQYAGLPLIEHIGDRYRMLTPYYERICIKTVKGNA